MKLKIGMLCFLILSIVTMELGATEATSSISVDVVDEFGSPVSDVVYDLIDENGDVLDTQTTGVDGIVTFDDVAIGEYKVIQQSVPLIYKDIDTTFRTNVVSLNQEYNLQDKLYYGDVGTIEVQRVNQYGDAITGSEMTIYDNKGEVVQVIVTDENGYAVSDSLRNGTYYLKETKAADGYELDTNIYKIVVDGTNIVEQYVTPGNLPEAKNSTAMDSDINNQSFNLSETGSENIIIAGLLIGLVLILYGFRLKKGDKWKPSY